MRLKDPEYRSALQKPFLDLVEKWIERGDSSGQELSDMLDSSQRSTVDNETLGLLVGMYEEEDKAGPPELSALRGKPLITEKGIEQRGEKFRKSSMKHLIDPKEFVEQHEMREGDRTAEKSRTADNIDSEDQKDEPASEYGYSHGQRFRSVLDHYNYIKEHYYLTASEKKQGEEAVSYKWLIHLLAKFISAKPEMVMRSVDKIERQLKTRTGYFVERAKQERKWLGQSSEIETDV